MSTVSASVSPGLNARIFRAASLVTLAGVVVKLVAMGKEMALAGIFGRSDAIEAFLIASLIPGLLVNIVSESMNQALIPIFVRTRAVEGSEAAGRLLANAAILSSGLLIAVSAAMAIGAPFYLSITASNFPPEKLHLALQLFYLLLPSIIFTGIASNCSAVLNTLDRYAVPAIAPVVTPLLVAVSAIVLGARIGIWAIAAATVAGAVLHAFWMTWLMNTHGYRLCFSWLSSNAETREVAGQYVRVLLSCVVACGGLFVDQSMAASLPAGSVSALSYANRFVSVVLTLFGGAIASSLTPAFSELVAQRDWQECRRAVRTWLGYAALVSVPVAAALICGAHWLIRISFQHGAFHAQDTQAVTPVLVMYAIQIPFFVCSRVFYRFLLALRRADVILWCGIINLALDVLLNLALRRVMGVAGIALATSLWTISTFVFLGWWARRLIPAEYER